MVSKNIEPGTFVRRRKWLMIVLENDHTSLPLRCETCYVLVGRIRKNLVPVGEEDRDIHWYRLREVRPYNKKIDDSIHTKYKPMKRKLL